MIDWYIKIKFILKFVKHFNLHSGFGQTSRRRPEPEDPDRPRAPPVVGVPAQLLGAALKPSRRISGEAIDLGPERDQERRIQIGKRTRWNRRGLDDLVDVDDGPSRTSSLEIGERKKNVDTGCV